MRTSQPEIKLAPIKALKVSKTIKKKKISSTNCRAKKKKTGPKKFQHQNWEEKNTAVENSVQKHQ